MSEQASSSSAPPKKAPAPAADVDIERLLSREANAFQRELEVERILKAFKLKYVHHYNSRTILGSLITAARMKSWT